MTSDNAVPGELRIAGRDSELVLRDEREIHISANGSFSLRGHLYEHTRITLVDCLLVGQSSRRSHGRGVESFSACIFPHYIIEGRTYFPAEDASIRAVSFTFADAPALFYDFDAFGSVTQDAGSLMQAIGELHRQKFGRALPIGPNPSIAYFAGQPVIVEVDTEFGKFTVEHRPSWPGGGPTGVRLDNQIWVTLKPAEAVTLDVAVGRLLSLLRFIALAVGRRQTVAEFAIETLENAESQYYTVHWSHHLQRRPGGDHRPPHPADLPLDPLRHTTEFRAALVSWLQREAEWRAARVRIEEGASYQNSYPIHRLVGAANAFDLLPDSAVPATVALSDAIQETRKTCRALFKALPPSDEREALLRAVGRLGQATLKQKVRHRANLITQATKGQYLAELDTVCNLAVEARNHYVHGSPVNCDVERQGSFLTDTLEFVFLASDLVEAGWDIRRCISAGTTMSHPFGSYWGSYAERLRRLRDDTAPPAATHDP